MYDVSNRDSFTCLETWISELNRYSTKTNIVKMVVGNKIDQVFIFIYLCLDVHSKKVLIRIFFSKNIICLLYENIYLFNIFIFKVYMNNIHIQIMNILLYIDVFFYEEINYNEFILNNL